MGEKKFRAKQIFQWLHVKCVNDFSLMSNLSNDLKEKLKSVNLKFKVKTGKNDQGFGSISTKQIASELDKLGYKIDKKKIVLSSPISSLGFHEINIMLHKNVTATIRVELTK